MMIHTKTIMLFASLTSLMLFCDAFQQRPVISSTGTSASTRASAITRRNDINNDNSNSRLYVSTVTDPIKTKRLPGTADVGMPWEDLGFEYLQTNSHLKLTWKDGEGWSKPELVAVSKRVLRVPSISLNIPVLVTF